MKTSLHSPTKSQQKLHNDLREMGCCVCRFITKPEVDELETPAIHHITEGGKRLGHWHVIPLCKIHHQYGVDGHPSIHSHMGKNGGKSEFKKTYGVDEYDLMERCEAYLDIPYCSEHP